MRDPDLYPFYTDISTLPGVGPKMRTLLEKLTGGTTLLDLVYHLPSNWIDRRNRGTIAEALADEVATVTGVVDQFNPSRGKAPARIRIRDESGFMTLVYFRANSNWLERTFKKGSTVMASGLVQDFDGGRQILHPDHVVNPEKEEAPPEVEPVYPMTAGVTGRQIRKFVASALDLLPDLEEWIDTHLLNKSDWPSFCDAMDTLHRPKTYDPDAFALARKRLAYDEALAREIAMGQARLARENSRATGIQKSPAIERDIMEALPFKPTRAQMNAFADVSSDISRNLPMRRLIQGDVGSGKTLVAALAAAQVAAAGKLTALMSPTEVLARQQAEAFNKFLEPAGIKCAPLTARDKGASRASLLSDIREGKIQAVSGTQALYQSDVDLPNLALIIIDEQHRFGVADRMKLSGKGVSPHMLVMSATPIPRTLALAYHGDMDISIIDEKPANRKDVTTAAMPDSRTDEVMVAVARAIRRGERAFWICPAVDSEDAGDAAATVRREILEETVRAPVEIVHGRMAPAERDLALERFKQGKSKVLVATTVIEVGVDVPEATIIVIERSDKFGLAQLHQLRGRVGRGDKASSCLLIYRPPLTEAGKERLDILRRSSDGFEIAEADFKLRGAGDVLGARQSGAPEFRVLDLANQQDLIELARSDAKSLLAGDPKLASGRGKSARHVRDLLAPRLAALVAPDRNQDAKAKDSG